MEGVLQVSEAEWMMGRRRKSRIEVGSNSSVYMQQSFLVDNRQVREWEKHLGREQWDLGRQAEVQRDKLI